MRFIYSKTFVRIFSIFVLLALLVIFDARGYTGFVKDGFFRTYGYGVGKLTAVTSSVKTSFQIFLTIKRLAKENAQLNLEVDQLAFENARLKSARDENLALRRALNFTQESKFNLLPVEVIISDPTGFTQTIVIDKGGKQGIHQNQPIVIQPGLLVGKVTKVYPDSAEVTLITDPSIVINGEDVDSSARGLVKGEHGLGLAFDLITQNELIKTGDEVITSGLSNDFPRGLLIGNVTAIRSSNSDLFQKAFITPAVDLRNLRFLFAIQ